MKSLYTITLTLLIFSATLQAGSSLETATAEYRDLPREYRLDGIVEAINQSTMSAQTGGQIEDILFDVDDYVEKGALIVRLKDTEQRSRLARAQADLKAAKAHLQDAQQEFGRVKEIFARKLLSRSAMDKADTTLKAAKATRDAARAASDQAKEQLEYTRVRAPYSGIVIQRHMEVGEVATPGQKLISGISLDQLRVNVDVPQSLISAVRTTDKASVQQPGNGYIPVVRLVIFPFAQHGSNTFKVRLDLPEGTKQMFPGMFVKTTFEVGTRKALLIPAQAVVYRSEVIGVYVMQASGNIMLRHIRAGHKVGNDMISVLSGLDEGEKVALDPIAAGAALKALLSEKRHD
ncbi:efflux RND transporter periplasmic adaptor subunit [Candidatus Vondammii sp. HM_W22]|uniref:efflux RND transporter periplasmic adaptor subunit n=1 Tax=Candidatus Vondammii sp. HM_W22 TaxID=2687299 RepID=UPI001F1320AF|nr:efflux RND transporter periplasmic adaptor subunit [Candidatus Vondammii sp. HM_W22]